MQRLSRIKSARRSTIHDQRLAHTSAHKHCRICGINIDAKAEPRICKNADCETALEKREKNDRMMRIMFFIFVGIFFVPILLSSVGILG